ncbi:MAG: phosphoenolpyruvate--protein phosphotransferase [Waddliaceae bacterium]
MNNNSNEMRLKGIPICRGVAIGKLYFFTFDEGEVPEFTIPSKKVDEEVSRYINAITRSKDDLKRLQKKLKREHILEGAAILDAHIEMMQDPLLTTDIEEEIRKTRKNAEFVFQAIIKKCQKRFQSISDPYFRERFNDIQDIAQRVMGYLRKNVRTRLWKIPQNSVVFSTELTASCIAEANVSFVDAFVTATGGVMSHAAIVAKAKGIPYVTDINFEHLSHINEQNFVIVDGRKGEVIINPNQETLNAYLLIKRQWHTHIHTLQENRSLSSETKDGHKIKLFANVDMESELDTIHEQGGQGIGLFRSEYIFLSNDSFPSEEEQFGIYRRIAEKMNNLPVVIRTFDFGGDKLMLNHAMSLDGNPFLGCRAIRYLLRERDIFKSQLRAILRASAYGNLSVMFPMISQLSELVEAKEILFEARQELEKRSVDLAETMRIGCMIEVPSAAIMTDLLAKECDFLAIGTNDLVQYLRAVPRGYYSTSGFYASTDPSVIRMIQHVVKEANNLHLPVAVCGEIAADPRFTPLLIGLGIHELSVACRYIPLIKRTIRALSMAYVYRLTQEISAMSNAHDIFELLHQEYRRANPEDQFYHC